MSSCAPPSQGTPFLWGPAAERPADAATLAVAAIDGDAGTVITKWDGDPKSLDWVKYDVTSLPYRLRSGDVAVIGVGGGRDILTAIWAGNTRITGVEINESLIAALRGRYRDFAGIADRPGRDADPRRSPVLSHPDAGEVRRPSDVADRHVGGDRRRGIYALRERPLHTRRLAGLPAAR